MPVGSQRMYPTTQDSRIFDAGPREAGIHIAIADDYPVLLAGMRQSLAPCDDIVVVAECTRIQRSARAGGLEEARGHPSRLRE